MRNGFVVVISGTSSAKFNLKDGDVTAKFTLPTHKRSSEMRLQAIREVILGSVEEKAGADGNDIAHKHNIEAKGDIDLVIRTVKDNLGEDKKRKPSLHKCSCTYKVINKKSA